MRLRDLLGVSLDELKTLLAAEEARAELRTELSREDVAPPAGASCSSRRSGTSSASSSSYNAAAPSSPSSRPSSSDKRRRVHRLLGELDAEHGALSSTSARDAH